jgi:hypothetical protein
MEDLLTAASFGSGRIYDSSTARAVLSKEHYRKTGRTDLRKVLFFPSPKGRREPEEADEG